MVTLVLYVDQSFDLHQKYQRSNNLVLFKCAHLPVANS